MTGRLHSLRSLGAAAMFALLLLLVLAPCGSVCCTRSGALGAHAVGVKAIAPTAAIGPRTHVATPTSQVVADAAWYRLHPATVQLGRAATDASSASALGWPATHACATGLLIFDPAGACLVLSARAGTSPSIVCEEIR